MTRKNVWLGVALSLAVPVVVLASNLLVPNSFTPGTTISSSQVNANFAAVQNAVNSRVDAFGDGSGGSVMLAMNTNWSTTPPANQNFQFTDLTVGPGVTLTVPSGVVIRVTGNFSNQGTITVQSYVAGGIAIVSNTAAPIDGVVSMAGAGIARSSAASGERALGATQQAVGGTGGQGIGNPVSAGTLLRPGPAGGGGGAGCSFGAMGTLSGYGANGGGTLVIAAGGTLANTGTINANGDTAVAAGTGGGGGGVVILTAKTMVTNTGTINARGGDGGPSGVSNGTGGGGGGGVVQLIAPTATNQGTITVSGGAGGLAGAAGSVTSTVHRQGGAGGGGSYGAGGNGGSVSVSNTPSTAFSSGAGISIIRTMTDPTSIL